MFTNKGKPEGSSPSTTPSQGEPMRQAATRPAARSAPSLFTLGNNRAFQLHVVAEE